MRIPLCCKRLVIMLLLGAVVLPGSLRGVESRSPTADTLVMKPLDVKLNRRDGFVGQLVNSSGKPQAGETIELRRDERLIGTAQTDKHGRFAFRELRTGVYQVQAPDAAGVYRVWATKVAPPAAQPEVLLVQGDVVRGQHAMAGPGAGLYDGKVMHSLASPWVFAGVVAAGVAVPVIVSQSNDDEGS